jgi:hypothetical protein
MRYTRAGIWLLLHLGCGIFAGWLSANLLTDWKVVDPGQIWKLLLLTGSMLFAGNKYLYVLIWIVLTGGTLFLLRYYFALRSDAERRAYRIPFFLYGFVYAVTVTFMVRHCIENMPKIQLFS